MYAQVTRPKAGLSETIVDSHKRDTKPLSARMMPTDKIILSDSCLYVKHLVRIGHEFSASFPWIPRPFSGRLRIPLQFRLSRAVGIDQPLQRHRPDLIC